MHQHFHVLIGGRVAARHLVDQLSQVIELTSRALQISAPELDHSYLQILRRIHGVEAQSCWMRVPSSSGSNGFEITPIAPNCKNLSTSCGNAFAVMKTTGKVRKRSSSRIFASV